MERRSTLRPVMRPMVMETLPCPARSAAQGDVPGAGDPPESENITMTLDGEPAVIADIPQPLQNIIYNLCDNAIKYNCQHGSVTVKVENQADSMILSVADTGIGIPPGHQERIFERFYRVDKGCSKEPGGTGLGLSIVKHAARLHGANAELQSVVEVGTTITASFSKTQIVK